MRLYIGNLSFETTEDDIRSHFGPHGTIMDVKIMIDRDTTRSRGFGFVTFSNAAEGQAAIKEMHGKEVHGRALTVNEARPREDRPGGGSGGGGRRFNKGGGHGGGGGGGGGGGYGGGGKRNYESRGSRY